MSCRRLPSQAILIGCLGSVYVKDAATGGIRSIAHAGDHAPGGGVYRAAYSPVMNNQGDIVFLGDLTVLILVIFFPILATWLPGQLTTTVFK